MRHLLATALALAAIASLGCTERRPAAAERDAQRTPEARPATAPEVPHDIPPQSHPEAQIGAADSEVRPDPEATQAMQPEAPAPRARAAETQPDQVLETIETDSGLIIEILRRGTGEEVRPGDTIVVHYHGTLADGRTFDSSYERNQPLRANLFGGVIPGWQEGIPGMRIGGKRRLIIPPELGYGARARPNIPANSLLIFEVELLEIVR